MIILTALWLGILTSISPCPLATNVAAVSFLSKRIAHPGMVFLSGAAYTAGRMLAYAMLGFLIVKSVLSVPSAANFLQKYMNKALGPILILAGIFLLDLVKFNIPHPAISEKHQNKLAGSGIPGAFLLGFVFALSFCPISAAIFFGSLIPLAVDSSIGLSLPFIYGAGTGLPVLIFALGIAAGITSLSHWFNKVIKLEIYARKITGGIFIAVGAYYVFNHILRF
ncbi:MAG: aromatic aminobenezylarsenical efflux permease ArsG family transporter [Candidatus Omnitrophica bacterium]|nr:aromatic aminobenezylarsenical efflux permease ArsG family transporter [Candidatus Omnitrophota bacterium]